mgnify:CR=1 FL=1
MRKFVALFVCVSTLFMVTGCGEKSTEDKAKDALEQASDDAKDAAKEAEKSVSKVFNDLAD